MDKETAIAHFDRQIAELEARITTLRNEPSASSGLLGDELAALLRQTTEMLRVRRDALAADRRQLFRRESRLG